MGSVLPGTLTHVNYTPSSPYINQSCCVCLHRAFLCFPYIDSLEIGDDSIQMKKDLEKFMYQVRIEAKVKVVEMVGWHLLVYSVYVYADLY